MEMYKNRNDVPYLVIIAILAGMAAIASFLGVLMINKTFESPTLFMIEILLVVFTFIGLIIFSLLYPFHLLNVDYKNRVMSLIFASGVSRGKYYFVKISATLLANLAAIFTILFIPIVTFLIVYQDIFVEFVRNAFVNFGSSDILLVVLSSIIGFIANIVMLTTAVIITKGKVSGIFLYFAFSWIMSSLQGLLLPKLGVFNAFESVGSNIENYFYIVIISSIVQIVAFVLIGLNVLKKQDL
jgi:ABC-type transport system involved in multi-copper enzyme maturation permease subunit